MPSNIITGLYGAVFVAVCIVFAAVLEARESFPLAAWSFAFILITGTVFVANILNFIEEF